MRRRREIDIYGESMREAILKYLKRVHRYYNIFRILLFIGLCVTVFFAMQKNEWAIALIVAIALLYIAVAIVLGVNFFQKTVVDATRKGTRLEFSTEKKKYSYQLSCVKKFEKKGRKYVVVFEDEVSRDSFFFYQNLPFKSYAFSYFTEEKMKELFFSEG